MDKKLQSLCLLGNLILNIDIFSRTRRDKNILDGQKFRGWAGAGKQVIVIKGYKHSVETK